MNSKGRTDMSTLETIIAEMRYSVRFRDIGGESVNDWADQLEALRPAPEAAPVDGWVGEIECGDAKGMWLVMTPNCPLVPGQRVLVTAAPTREAAPDPYWGASYTRPWHAQEDAAPIAQGEQGGGPQYDARGIQISPVFTPATWSATTQPASPAEPYEVTVTERTEGQRAWSGTHDEWLARHGKTAEPVANNWPPLLRYGRHDADCATRHDDAYKPKPVCTCGYIDALTAAKASPAEPVSDTLVPRLDRMASLFEKTDYTELATTLRDAIAALTAAKAAQPESGDKP
jgi:hypothetical protein